ncbi:hexose kinase [Burkholderia oklahomensis]|uniref:1-phosphofructokinase family hexose kinase n=1 Tax=Burkholderia oklahomensis TaxID=342113 RepID=UPI0026570102|nr:hexose kinase [Burkholderia oklahomensis]MDN7673630.1 hexose kinase [Burkholderia oklahomensis]
MTTVVTVTPHPALDQTVRVPNLTLGDVNRAASLEFNAGGKGVNVAGCLADYGIATIATGLLGAADSAAFDAMFADKRIVDRFVRIAGRTRINVKLVDPARGETTDINLATSLPTPDDVAALERRMIELAAPGRWFVLAGSLPPGVDASFYRRATRALHGAGARVALDTSGAPLADALAADDPRELPDLVKPNLVELEAALGRALGDDDAIVHAACELAARGIAYVVVSLGAKGALGVAAGASGASEASEASEAPAVSKASIASKASVGSRTFDAGESSKRATGETVDALASSSASSGGDGRPSSTGRSASPASPASTSPTSTSPASTSLASTSTSTSTTAGASTSPQRTPPHPAIYRIFRATPPRVPVASTVGAGDAFVAGLVASLTEARAWGDAGRRATAFAAAKLARVGPHLPDRATLDALAAQVEVETFTLAAAADGVVHS